MGRINRENPVNPEILSKVGQDSMMAGLFLINLEILKSCQVAFITKLLEMRDHCTLRHRVSLWRYVSVNTLDDLAGRCCSCTHGGENVSLTFEPV
jgi:hypothetical protein